MGAPRFRVPATFRNPNFLQAGIGWSIPAVVALVAAAGAGLPSGTAVAIVVVLGGLVAYYFASWFRRTLRVFPDRIVIGHVFSHRDVPWDHVGEFAIREPPRRTPIMLAFHWWADEAEVTLTDGSVLRLAGLEPRHGITALSLFSIVRRTAADEAVEWLNDLRRRSAPSANA